MNIKHNPVFPNQDHPYNHGKIVFISLVLTDYEILYYVLY